MSHWCVNYIGEPWVANTNDCWAFARKVWRNHFGLEVPIVNVDPSKRLDCMRAFSVHNERSHWELTDKPEEGDGVLLFQNKYPSHVGIWVNPGPAGVLHCLENSGVVFQDTVSLKKSGWAKWEFYKKCTS